MKNNKGSSLLEVAIAGGLIAVVFMGLSTLTIMSQALILRSHAEQQARLATQHTVEEVHNKGGADPSYVGQISNVPLSGACDPHFDPNDPAHNTPGTDCRTSAALQANIIGTLTDHSSHNLVVDPTGAVKQWTYTVDNKHIDGSTSQAVSKYVQIHVHYSVPEGSK